MTVDGLFLVQGMMPQGQPGAQAGMAAGATTEGGINFAEVLQAVVAGMGQSLGLTQDMSAVTGQWLTGGQGGDANAQSMADTELLAEMMEDFQPGEFNMTQLLAALQPIIIQTAANAANATPTGGQSVPVEQANPGAAQLNQALLANLSAMLSGNGSEATPTAANPNPAAVTSDLQFNLSNLSPQMQTLAQQALGNAQSNLNPVNLNPGQAAQFAAGLQAALQQQTGTSTASGNNNPLTAAAASQAQGTGAQPAGVGPQVQVQAGANAAQVEVQAEVTPLSASNPVQATAPTQTVTPLIQTASAQAPLTQQVAEAIQMTVHRGGSEVRLQLHPEALGQLHIQLQMNDGELSVRMLAETAQARAMIQEYLPQLRSTLSAQGLQMDQLAVAVGSDTSAFDQQQRQFGSTPQEDENRRYQNQTADNIDAVGSTTPTSDQQNGLYAVDYQA